MKEGKKEYTIRRCYDGNKIETIFPSQHDEKSTKLLLVQQQAKRAGITECFFKKYFTVTKLTQTIFPQRVSKAKVACERGKWKFKANGFYDVTNWGKLLVFQFSGFNENETMLLEKLFSQLFTSELECFSYDAGLRELVDSNHN